MRAVGKTRSAGVSLVIAKHGIILAVLLADCGNMTRAFFLFPTRRWDTLLCQLLPPSTRNSNRLLSLMFLDALQAVALDGLFRHRVGARSDRFSGG